MSAELPWAGVPGGAPKHDLQCVWPECPDGPGPHTHRPPWEVLGPADRSALPPWATGPDPEWERLVAAKGDQPEACSYCGLETRPFSEWADGSACSRCGGTLDCPPPWPGHGCGRISACEDPPALPHSPDDLARGTDRNPGPEKESNVPRIADQRRGTYLAALIVHALGKAGPDTQIAYSSRWVQPRHGCVTVRYDLPWCADCPAVTGDAWVMPGSLPPGYSLAVVVEHASSCPWLAGHIRAQEGGQP